MRGLSDRTLTVIAIVLVVTVAIVAIAGALLAPIEGITGAGTPYVALIRIEGTITPSTDYTLLSLGRGVDDYVQLIEKARRDPLARAVVLYVNSPGGTAGASETLFYAIRKLSREKVVVSYVADYGTSGAYMAILPSDWIVAANSSVVGSIGVYTVVISYEGLLNKLGIRSYTFKSGKFKDVGSPFRNMTSEDAEVFRDMIKDLFEVFKKRVLQYRRADLQVFSGRPFTAPQAMELGLIDDIGDLDVAIDVARTIAGLPGDAPIREVKPRTPGLLEILFGMNAQRRVKLFPSYEILAMWPPPAVMMNP